MDAPARDPDVVIVGAGVIGLSVAWRAAQRGMTVTVLERGSAGCGTSRVAAGMLAPVAEAEFGGAARKLLELNVRSGRLWPAFAADLEQASGESVGLLRTGTLLVAGDADEAAELERQCELRESLGLQVRRLRPSEAREAEPALAPALRLALEAPDDHSVDPRRVIAALRRACEQAGVELREQVAVAGVRAGSGAPTVALADGGLLDAGQVVLAAGAWTRALDGVAESQLPPVRPVKGQIVRLRDPSGPGLLTRPVRYAGGYLVPRADGRYVLGGTVEERGFDVAPTAGGIYEMLRHARELVPNITELEIEELVVGLRPGTPDNTPVIGRGELEGVVWATGHYRNGILLAPLTAELAVAALGGAAEPPVAAEADELLQMCSPLRFASSAVEAGR